MQILKKLAQLAVIAGMFGATGVIYLANTAQQQTPTPEPTQAPTPSPIIIEISTPTLKPRVKSATTVRTPAPTINTTINCQMEGDHWIIAKDAASCTKMQKDYIAAKYPTTYATLAPLPTFKPFDPLPTFEPLPVYTLRPASTPVPQPTVAKETYESCVARNKAIYDQTMAKFSVSGAGDSSAVDQLNKYYGEALNECAKLK